VRDADVLSSHLRASADSLGGGDAAKAVARLQPLDRERHDAQRALVSILDSERYRRLITLLENAAIDPAFDLPKKALHRVAARQFRKAVKRGDPS
jgi:CHAD domain-containing protein